MEWQPFPSGPIMWKLYVVLMQSCTGRTLFPKTWQTNSILTKERIVGQKCFSQQFFSTFTRKCAHFLAKATEKCLVYNVSKEVTFQYISEMVLYAGVQRKLVVQKKRKFNGATKQPTAPMFAKKDLYRNNFRLS